jgi:hypothetical protein
MSGGPVLLFGLLEEPMGGLLNPLGELDFELGADDQMD